MSNESEHENSALVENGGKCFLTGKLEDNLSFEENERLLLDIAKETEMHKENKWAWRRVLNTFNSVKNMQPSLVINRIKKKGTNISQQKALKVSCGGQENSTKTSEFLECSEKKKYKSSEAKGIRANLSLNDNMNITVSKSEFVEHNRAPETQKRNKEAWQKIVRAFDRVKYIPYYTTDKQQHFMYASDQPGKCNTDWSAYNKSSNKSVNKNERVCTEYESPEKMTKITETDNILNLNNVSVISALPMCSESFREISKSLILGTNKAELINNNSPLESDIESSQSDSECIRSGPEWELDLFIKTIENDLRRQRKLKPIRPIKGGYVEKFKAVTRKIGSDVKFMSFQERMGMAKGLRGIIIDREMSYGVNAAKVQFENSDICIVFLNDLYRTVKPGRTLVSFLDNSNYYMAGKLHIYLQTNRVVQSGEYD